MEDFTTSTKKLLDTNLAHHLAEFQNLKSDVDSVLKNIQVSAKEHSEAVNASKQNVDAVREKSEGLVAEKEVMDEKVLDQVREKQEQMVRRRFIQKYFEF